MRYALFVSAALSLYALLPGCMTNSYVDEMRDRVREEAKVIDSRMQDRLGSTAEKVSEDIRKEAAGIRESIDLLRELVEEDIGEFKGKITRIEGMLEKYEKLFEKYERLMEKYGIETD